MLAGSATAAPPCRTDYGKLPAVEELKLSPSGEKVAYLAVAGDDRKLMITPLGGGPQLAMKVGALQLRGVRWLDDGHLLVDTADTVDVSGNPAVKKSFGSTQSIIVDAASGKATVVFSDSGQIYPATFGVYGAGQEGAAPFGYFGGITMTGVSVVGPIGANEHGKRTDLYKVNLDTGRSERLAEEASIAITPGPSAPKGVVIAHTDFDPHSREWLSLYAGADDTVLVAK